MFPRRLVMAFKLGVVVCGKRSSRWDLLELMMLMRDAIGKCNGWK